MRTLVIGDIHGAHKALLQCLERSAFNKNEDRLIVLGDIVDGWPETVEVIEELMTIKDLIFVVGNHDVWAIDYLRYGTAPRIWVSQGGQATLDSFMSIDSERLELIRGWMNRYVKYHEQDDMLFVHGGYNWFEDIKGQDTHDLTWDRNLWGVVNIWKKKNVDNKIKGYDYIFIGHTTTSRIDDTLNPVLASNVWNLDQGCGWEGKLTIMDIHSKEYWQSDITKDLYPNIKGR
jgi:serine/threonine protein phosphatase 1